MRSQTAGAGSGEGWHSGQRKLSTYSRAELTMMANALIAPWFIEQVRAKIAERNSQAMRSPKDGGVRRRSTTQFRVFVKSLRRTIRAISALAIIVSSARPYVDSFLCPECQPSPTVSTSRIATRRSNSQNGPATMLAMRSIRRTPNGCGIYP